MKPMNERIIQYIQEQLLGGDSEEDISVEDDLLNSGLLDSLGIVRLIAFIEGEYGIKVPPQDMVIANFVSVEAMVNYISNKLA